IWECLELAGPEKPSAIPILLGIAPLDRPHRRPQLDDEILDEIEWRFNLVHHPQSTILPMGNVSGVHALVRARQVLAYGLARFCVVAGVDSFVDQDVVEAYMAQNRIMTNS